MTQTQRETRHDENVPDICPAAWGHGTGEIQLGGAISVPSSWEELAQRVSVQDTVARYAWAYDERRIDVLNDIFTPDVAFAFSVSGGGFAEYSGRDAVVGWLSGIMEEQHDQRRHLGGNVLVERLDGSEATVLMYFALFASASATELVTTGFYRFTLRRVDDRWLIEHVYDGLDRPF